MEQRVLKFVYGIGWACMAIIRIPARWRARTNRIVVDRKTAQEKSLLALLGVGMVVLPFVHIFTPWLKFANYKLRSWAGWTGTASFAVGLWLLWRAHADLGRNWSEWLRLRQGHQLVTTGIYRHIRHPMYAFGWLLGIAQALLLQNWIAGLSGLVSFALLYFLRVPREEQMMLGQFGDEYQAYMNRTGRVIPRLNWIPVLRQGESMSESALWLLWDTYRARKQGQAAIAQRQRARLAEMVAFARANSPYYRELYQDLPEHVEDPTMLPVTNKKKLMARFDDWVTDREVTIEKSRPFVENPDLFGKQFLGKYLVITTSGTTGTHGIFLTDQRTLSVVGPLFLRMLSVWLGLRDLIRIIAGGGRIASVLARGTPTATGVGISRLGPRLGKALQALSVHTSLPELVVKLNKFQPVIFTSYGTVTKLLAGEQEAGRLHIKPVLILLTAEGLPPDEYDHIARVFNTKVANSYAASECQFMSSNCEHGWLHVNSDWVVFEPVDADYRPVPPGVQSHTVLISNLANRVQPILRYDLGDSILQRPDPCPCGNPLPAIRVQGRAADVLTFPTEQDERITLPPLLFGTSIYDIPGIEQFQIVQTAPANLRVRLRLEAGADPDGVWQAVHTRLTRLLTEHKLNHVTLERTEEPPEQSAGGKYREVIPLKGVTQLNETTY